jgi:hypothetical protein
MMGEWQELVFEGSVHVMRALVVGFEAGRGEASASVFAADIDLEPEAFGERLKALFTCGSHHVVFMPGTVAVPLAAAVAAHGAPLGLRLERRRVVESTTFPFRIEAFSHDEATKLRALIIESVPAGARIENLSEQEEKHPDARGPEPFAPLHAYTYRASGHVCGAFDAVIEHWKRARGQDFTEVGPISVDGRTVQ